MVFKLPSKSPPNFPLKSSSNEAQKSPWENVPFIFHQTDPQGGLLGKRRYLGFFGSHFCSKIFPSKPLPGKGFLELEDRGLDIKNNIILVLHCIHFLPHRPVVDNVICRQINVVFKIGDNHRDNLVDWSVSTMNY